VASNIIRSGGRTENRLASSDWLSAGSAQPTDMVSTPSTPAYQEVTGHLQPL
jgi:hypothetical protein